MLRRELCKEPTGSSQRRPEPACDLAERGVRLRKARHRPRMYREIVMHIRRMHLGDGTPAAPSLSAYAMPSSRSTSYSAVVTRVGGSGGNYCNRSGDTSGSSGEATWRILLPDPAHQIRFEPVAGGILGVGKMIRAGWSVTG